MKRGISNILMILLFTYSVMPAISFEKSFCSRDLSVSIPRLVIGFKHSDFSGFKSVF